MPALDQLDKILNADAMSKLATIASVRSENLRHVALLASENDKGSLVAMQAYWAGMADLFTELSKRLK